MPGDKKHYAVNFAERYRNESDGLNAFAALWRLVDLQEDILLVRKYIEISHPDGPPFYPWVGAEVVSYFAVGFVTCLEWHGRSRLVDLLTSFPTAFKTEDLKVMKEKTVVETVVANVTVASVVGAATNISSFQDYMGVFSRLFAAMKLPFDAYAAIKLERGDSGEPWVQENEIENLKELFRFRNDLVHEIGISRIGHHNLRERWDVESATEIGGLVERTIRALETVITAHAPAGFANVLGADGIPRSEIETLAEELPGLETKIAKAVASFADYDEDGFEKNSWAQACNLSKAHLDSELEFIENVTMLHSKYVDLKGPLKLALVKARHAYLCKILGELVGTYDMKNDGSIMRE